MTPININILDYGSGTPERAIEVWEDPRSVEIISRYTREHIGALTVTAYDPLANSEITTHTTDDLTLHSVSDLRDIPETVDHITVLHPDPEVIEGSGITIPAYKSFSPELIDIIRIRLQPGGYIFVQLDDQIRDFERELLSKVKSERFIDTLKRLGGVREELSARYAPTFFSQGIWTRPSLHVFKKNI